MSSDAEKPKRTYSGSFWGNKKAESPVDEAALTPQLKTNEQESGLDATDKPHLIRQASSKDDDAANKANATEDAPKREHETDDQSKSNPVATPSPDTTEADKNVIVVGPSTPTESAHPSADSSKPLTDSRPKPDEMDTPKPTKHKGAPTPGEATHEKKQGSATPTGKASDAAVASKDAKTTAAAKTKEKKARAQKAQKISLIEKHKQRKAERAAAKLKKKKKKKKQPKLPKALEKSPLANKALSIWINHRVATIVTTLLIVALVSTYIAGGIYFSSHFLPRTTVNGNNVSLMSTSAFTEQSSNKAKDYSAQVTGDGVNLGVSGKDVDLVLDTNEYVNSATRQVPSWLWPIAIFSEQNYLVENGVSLDKAKVAEYLKPAISKVNANPTPTTNATIALDTDTNDFVVVKEKLGTEIDSEAATEKVANNMAGLNATITLGDQELVQPAISATDSDFKAALNDARNFPDLNIELTLGGETVEILDSDLVRSWLIIDDNCKVTANLDDVVYYTRNTLSAKLDSVGSYRTYTRPDGKSIQIHDGTYGWNINGDELAKLIVDRIENKSSKPIEIPCNSTAAVYNPGGADWGSRYIDVDLQEQHARMYDDAGNLIWESECVSGGPAEGNDTVTGVFYIEDKESPKKLIGLDSNGDGEPDYENDVTFWMPFWGGYGFHDATWRYTFGGEEYLYDGSHGCVNLPYDTAELLYYLTEVGDPVIVHW